MKPPILGRLPPPVKAPQFAYMCVRVQYVHAGD